MLALLLAAAAAATPAFTLTPGVDLVSDYRFRGLSLNDRRPAVQPTLTLTHRGGGYASAWASQVADNGGDAAEIDLVGGYAHKIGDWSFDLSAVAYLYPGARASDYGEGIAVVRHPLGPLDAGLTFAWAPRQDAIGGLSNRYLAADLRWEHGQTALTASAGLEDGAFGDAKRDWSIGLERALGPVRVGAAYVDTARSGAGRLGAPGLVLTLSASGD